MDDNEPTTPDATADAADAAAAHDADRAPTAAEERAAEEAASDVDPASAEAYRESIERGAAVEGEGQIVPDDAP